MLINLFIVFTYQIQSPLSFLSSSTLPHPLSHYTLPCSGYQPTLAHQISLGLSTSSPTEAREGILTRRKGSKGRQQREFPLQLLENLREDQAAHLLNMRKGPRSSPCMLFCWWLCLCEPHGPRFVSTVGLLVLSLTNSGPSFLPSTLPQESQASPIVWLSVAASVSISCWMKPLRV